MITIKWTNGWIKRVKSWMPDQGQMDSCSFCKHLTEPRSGQVVCLIEVIMVNWCKFLIAVSLQLGDNQDNLGSSDVGQIWKAKKQWDSWDILKMVQNMVKHVERRHHMTMTNCPSCNFSPKFKFTFNRCNILDLPPPPLLAIKQMPLIYICSAHLCEGYLQEHS